MFKYLTVWALKKIKKLSEPVNPKAYLPPHRHPIDLVTALESLSPPLSPLSPRAEAPGAILPPAAVDLGSQASFIAGRGAVAERHLREALALLPACRGRR